MNNQQPSEKQIFDHRQAGVLLHPSSLPGPQAQGDIGQSARNFIRFMADAGLKVWQVLPLGPTHIDRSPYQCLSTHAGNTELIDLEWLQRQGWLQPLEINHFSSYNSLQPLLRIAAKRFAQQADETWQQKLDEFIQQHTSWLPDYALYQAIKLTQNNESWQNWPVELRNRENAALKQAAQENADEIKSIQFAQFVFFLQWHELRAFAHEHGIKLFGDMPIYVSMDSADVWADKENFLMDSNGECSYVAGVPPDAFSDEGQFWGNPLYDWNHMESQNFNWWVNRFKTQLELFDYLRIDHFRGLQACWQIPHDAESAASGHWKDTPGYELLETLNQHFSPLPLVAEDLGLITTEVLELRDHYSLPGMAVLQFAFGSGNDNFYLPHNHRQNCVVYTGTHDNDTTLGWYQQLADNERSHLHEYMGHSKDETLNMPWLLNRMALASVANLAIIPMQDLLALDSSHRMNTPGTTEGNWNWRFDWSQVWPSLANDLNNLIGLYGRI